jgi:hypothetical protein
MLMNHVIIMFIFFYKFHITFFAMIFQIEMH